MRCYFAILLFLACPTMFLLGQDKARVLVPKGKEATNKGGNKGFRNTNWFTITIDNLEVGSFGTNSQKKANRREFDALLKSNTIETYTSVAIDEIVALLKADAKKYTDSQLASKLTASERRLNKLIVESAKTMPLSVYEAIRDDVARDLEKEFDARLEKLRQEFAGEIAKFRRQLETEVLKPEE